MESQVEQNQYVAQLKEVFNSCDPSGSGYLDKSGLIRLCQRLQLEDQASFLIARLLKNDCGGTVNFDEFKDCFVALLTQSSYIDESETSDFNLTMTSPEREMSPKYTWGAKKYGRRSRPESDDLDDLESEALSDYSDLEVFSNEHSSGDHSKVPLSVKCESPFTNDSNSLISPMSDIQPSFKKRRRSSIDQNNMQNISINDIETESKCNDRNLNRIDSENDSENEYLQAIWKTLSVGKNGFLDLEELEKVCQHIGMDNMSQEVVSQLFNKLDMDQDGKISFQEFRHLFENGDANTASTSRSSSKNSTPQRIPHVWNRRIKSEDDCCDVATESSSESGMFSSIDPDNSGCVNQEAIIEFWDSLGYQNGTQILKDFGFYSSVISLLDLSNVLENVIMSSNDNYLRQLALATVQQELKYSRNSLEQLREERNKLKTDITEANIRSSMLAQEVDDQNAKLEKTSQNKIMLVERKYKEQLQILQEELRSERDQVAAQVLKAQHILQDEIESLRKETFDYKDRLCTLQTDYDRLENEMREMTVKLKESERINYSQMKELEAFASLRQKLDELESGKIQEQHHEKLLIELQSLKLENQNLKDENDELTLQMESLRQQISTRHSAKAACHRRNGSSLGEYVRNSAIKRRGHEAKSSEDVEDSLSPRLGKIHCRTQEPDFQGSDLGHNYLNIGVNYEDEDSGNNVCDTNCKKQCVNNETALNNNSDTPLTAMCEIKQVFIYLRKRIAEEIMNDDCKSEAYITHQQKQRLEELEWERDNLEQQLDNMEIKYDKDLKCLQSRLEDAEKSNIIEAKKTDLVTTSCQTEISILSDRCQRLKKHLEVALNELEMALMREAQGEELLMLFEQKYLSLRNKLSNDLQSTCEIRMAGGDSSCNKLVNENVNTKVLHISSDLLQLVVDKLVRPVESINSSGDLTKMLFVALLDFLKNTKDLVGKIGNLCGVGLTSCKNYSNLMEAVCSNFEKWLNDGEKFYLENFIEQLKACEGKCIELERIIDEKNQMLQVAQEQTAKWRTKTENISEKLKVNEERSTARIVQLEQQVEDLSGKVAKTVKIEAVKINEDNKTVYETQTQTEKSLVDINYDVTIENLKSEELQLSERCDQLQSLKLRLEKEISTLRSDLQNKGINIELESDQNFASALTEMEFSSDNSENSFTNINVCRSLPLTLDGISEIQNLKYRLQHLEKRCKSIEEAARLQALEALKLQKTNNQQHLKEINQIKELLANTQTMLKQQAIEYEKQLTAADKLVKDLYVDNAQLMKALQITEERQKQAEKLNTHLSDKCDAMMHLVASIYQTASAKD